MLVSLSANHKTTDFAALERLSATGHGMPGLVNEAHDAIRGTVIISTCNRFEAYLDVAGAEPASPLAAVTAAIDRLASAAGLPAGELRESLEFAHGNAVAHHLFAVASGLESVVVGEDEIAGQVRRSLDHARATGTASPELERLFQRAAETSREVKNVARVGEAGRSIVRLALDLAASRVADWGTCRVLLVGTGRYAGASLAALRERGARDIRVYSVSNQGSRFAANHDIPIVHRADYAAEAALADVVVTCTTAQHHVLDAQTIAAGRAGLESARPSTPALALVDGTPPPSRQLVIDLGLPRNVNPDVLDLEHVELLDLETIRIHAPIDELASLGEARAIVARAARRFADAGQAQDIAPAVVALRRHVFDILDAEIDRARAKESFTPATEEALRHFAGVLLHQPMVQSRALAAAGESQEWIRAVSALFGVEAAEDLGAERDESRDTA